MGQEDTGACDGTGRRVALAERLAAEGWMNLNKLLEAAVYAEGRRAGWLYRPLIEAGTMAAEVAAVIENLDSAGPAAALLPALEAGGRMLAGGEQADLAFERAPDPYVCRTCGFVALGSPPIHCPECGAWPGRFRKFVSIYNGDNQEPVNPIEVIALLRQNADHLARLVEALTEEQLAARPSPTDWGLREHIAHFYDTQDMLDTRIDLMLDQDDPELKPLPVYELATNAALHAPSTAQMLAEFRDRRFACVRRLEALPLKDLWRTGRHPEFGRITILRQAAYMANHEQTHLSEIEALGRTVALSS